MLKHKCIRDCYYNERYWSIGEVIEDTPGFEDMPPNKHFLPLGAPNPMNDKPIVVSGDDPRSTKQIREDLESKYGIKKAKNTPRKKLFAAWREAEQNAGEQPRSTGGYKAPADDPEDGIIPANMAAGAPVNTKRVAEMSPDEIDQITKADIGKRLGVNPISYNKAGLIERAIEAGV